MKEKNNYSALWQKKRGQWKVDGNANADWLQMCSVLDSHMPVSGAITKPYNPGKLKWIYKFFIGISISAAISSVAYLSLSKKHNEAARDATVKESPIVQPRHSMPPDAAGKANNDGQMPKKATPIKSSSNDNMQGKNGISNKKTIGPVHRGNPSVADSAKEADYAKNTGSPRRDSVFLPLSKTQPRYGDDSTGNINKPVVPVHLNNLLIRKALADSVKRPAKKRHKVGVFL